MPIQQMLLGAGVVTKKTYVDDVFSTYLYTGSQGTQTITNGIDFANEGGMVWCKSRSSGHHEIADTVRGTATGSSGGRILRPNDNSAQLTGDNGHGFTSSGFTLGYVSADVNNANECTSWSFRKAPGFFDVVSWTGGDETYKNISHNLGSVPGCIIVKRTSGGSGDWFVYHRKLNGGTNSWQYRLSLNNSWSESSAGQSFLYSAPTATQFQIGDWFTGNGSNYIAYLFAGGESTAATARSVHFDGDDYFDTATSSDLDIGTGDFTIEFWVNFDDVNSSLECILETRSGGGATSDGIMLARWHTNTHENKVSVYMNGFLCEEKGSTPNGQWNHFAVVRSSGTTSLYKNGTFEDSFSDSNNWSNTSWNIGCLANEEGTHGNAMHGSISNFRFVKGTAVYTSAFRPTTEPLTNITNTKLLCCQSSTVTASTGVTLSASGNPTASTDSPFDDPAAHIFGESGLESVIKCGSYTKTDTGSSNTLHIELGWEPQIILQKRTDGSDDWYLMDVMREMGNDLTEILRPNSTGAEVDYGGTIVVPTATGFTVKDNNSDSYIYLAIRRTDGYVGKPADAGTDVFSLVAGRSSPEPTLLTNFVTDFGFFKYPTAVESWFVSARLIQGKYLVANTNAAEASTTSRNFDYNDGWSNGGLSGYQGWSWKRGQGFDVVTYKGNGSSSNREIAHSLNKAPQMMFIKSRSNAQPWAVYHSSQGAGKYFDGIGTGAVSTGNTRFGGVEPTSTHFTLGTSGDVNYDTYTYIAMLFASVDGISKVGSYTGNGSNRSISFGFQPRFMITKRASSTGYGWYVLDTVRGWSSGNDDYLDLSSTSDEGSYEFGTPTSTGLDIIGDGGAINENGANYIYYAHA